MAREIHAIPYVLIRKNSIPFRREISPDAMILTDDYAPLEYFTRKAI